MKERPPTYGKRRDLPGRNGGTKRIGQVEAVGPVGRQAFHDRMSRRQAPVTMVGLRFPSVCGFAMVSGSGIAALALGIGLLFSGEVIPGALLTVIGGPMIVYSVDFLARSIAPNRLHLDADGLSLQTWRRTTRWRWPDYHGVWGTGYLMLRVAGESGARRSIPIGHWSRELEHRLYRFASLSGSDVPEPPQRRPGLTPLFLLGGVLLLVALAVAVTALQR